MLLDELLLDEPPFKELKLDERTGLLCELLVYFEEEEQGRDWLSELLIELLI